MEGTLGEELVRSAYQLDRIRDLFQGGVLPW